MAITDTVSVMRRGEMVATRKTSETSVEELAELMVGRRVLLQVEKGHSNPGGVGAVGAQSHRQGWPWRHHGRQCLLRCPGGRDRRDCRRCGQRPVELLEALAGIRPPTSGEILIDGQPIARANPARLRELGLAHIPEDRHHMGLVLKFEEYENSVLGYHRDPKYGRGMLLDLEAIRRDAAEKIEKYDIRPPNCRLKTANFSRRQPAEDRGCPRNRTGPAHPADRPADPWRRYRCHRIHSQADHRHARPGARRCCSSRSNSTKFAPFPTGSS